MSTITNVTASAYYSTQSTSSSKTSAKQSTEEKTTESAAAVYEPSDKTTTNKTTSKKTYTKDSATVNRLLQEAEQRKQQLKDLVEKTLGKQSEVFTFANFNKFKTGEATLSAEQIAQAKEDVSEDGYWGVEQTSERLYSFAYALTGGDPDKADEMMSAIEKGFKQATKSWGNDLPDICKQTLEATREKINAWKTGNNGTTTEA